MPRSNLATPNRIAGVVIMLFGAWFLWQAMGLREGPGYAAVGPKTFPIIVGIGTIFFGLGVALERGFHLAPGPPQDSADSEAPDEVHDWRTLAMFAGLLAVYIALFLPLGFILCSILLITAGAWVLGSTSWPRDLAAGVVVSLFAYLVFTALLGLELPGGPLEAPLRILRPGTYIG